MTDPAGTRARATLLRGGPVARRLREEVRADAEAMTRENVAPHLRVIVVGEDPASRTYVAAKTRAAEESGITTDTLRLPSDASEDALLSAISQANEDPTVDGVLVQLPLPTRRMAERAFDRIAPEKDVDGLHPENVGRLHQGRPRFVPCTPAGIIALLDAHDLPIAGTRAVMIGRSEIVGKPLAALLTLRNATVTVCHSATRGLPEICRESDILVAAVGRPGLVRGDWIRKGAVVIDVGVNRFGSLNEIPPHLRESDRLRLALREKGEALAGDVAFEEALDQAGWITPVPGGVGPLTVAMLLKNTVAAARARRLPGSNS